MDYRKKGFTIIELLVVIVIIGVLASVVIVSFSNVSQRANVSSISSDLANVSKSIKLYQAEYSTYPYAIDCSASPIPTSSCIKSSPGNSLTYRGKANDFCLSVTNGSTSYYVNETTNNPTLGLCNITNYVTNPGFEGNTSTPGGPIGSSGGTVSIQSGGGHTGNYYLRANFTGSMIGRCQLSGILQPGLYRSSFWIRSNQAVQYVQYFDNAFGSNGTYRFDYQAGTVTLTPNTWTKFGRLFNLATTAQVCIGGYVPNYAAWTVSDYIDMDSVMVIEGNSNVNYADGTSAGWAWNATPNSSTSSGPPL